MAQRKKEGGRRRRKEGKEIKEHSYTRGILRCKHNNNNDNSREVESRIREVCSRTPTQLILQLLGRIIINNIMFIWSALVTSLVVKSGQVRSGLFLHFRTHI